MNFLYTFILILTFASLYIVVNYGLKVTLMYDRKDKKTMLKELWYNFSTDYSHYQKLPSEEVMVKSKDNIILKGVYHSIHENSNKVVIINHGYTANRYVGYQFVDIFSEQKYNILLIDMRSHGESEGKFASYGFYESQDMEIWVDWVRNRIGENAYIGLHGQSMGAATTMIYGGTHPDKIKFIIEDCGFTTAKEAIKFQFSQSKIPFFPLYHLIRLKAKILYKFDLNKVSPEKCIVNNSIPTLFIHGTNDKIVPCWMAKNLYLNKKGEKNKLYLVDGAGHMESYSKDKDKYKEVVKNFLNSI